MAPILIKLVLAPGLMAVATLAERAWGPRLAGVIAAFPAIVGPLLLVTAVEHGRHAAARAAVGTLLGLVALSAFTVAYAAIARRRGWRASLAAGWLASALAAGAAGAWARGQGALAAGAVATVSLALAGIVLTERAQKVVILATFPSRSPSLALRAGLTALLVTLLSLAVSRLGPTAGGMLAALPVVASMLAVFTHRQSGPHAATEFLRGTVIGMPGFVAFCELVALTIVSAGSAVAFTLATVAALVIQAGVVARRSGYAWARNSAGRSGEASASASFSPSASRSAA